jgi:hypothetical protein
MSDNQPADPQPITLSIQIPASLVAGLRKIVSGLSALFASRDDKPIDAMPAECAPSKIIEPAEPAAAAEVKRVAAPRPRKARVKRTLANRPAGDWLYFYGLPQGLDYTERCLLKELDRLGVAVTRAELNRRVCIGPKALNRALLALVRRRLVEMGIGGLIRFRICDPPADAVYPRDGDEAQLLEIHGTLPTGRDAKRNGVASCYSVST